MPRLAPALALTLLVANPVATQDVDLPIHDLVERAAVGSEPAHWIRHLRDGFGQRRILTGERQLLRGARIGAWLERGELRDMLAILSRVDGSDLGLGAATLTVSTEHVAGVREGLLWIRQQLPPRIALDITLERVGDDVRASYSDGTEGLPEFAPYDAIITTAASERFPHTCPTPDRAEPPKYRLGACGGIRYVARAR